MVSCIVAKESILLFLIHLLIRLRSSWQYLINFSKKCGLCEFVLEGRTVGEGRMVSVGKRGFYCFSKLWWWLCEFVLESRMVILHQKVGVAFVVQESILVFLIHSRIRLCSSWQYLTNFSKKCGLSEFFLGGRTVGGKIGGGYKSQMVSCNVAKESILLILIHSLIRLCSSQQYLINFSKKCGLCEFVLEGRTVWAAKWVVAIESRWYPALLLKSRFQCFSFIRS